MPSYQMASAGASAPKSTRGTSVLIDGGRQGRDLFSRALPANAAITACTVTDDRGRTWTRLPDVWRENAALCQAERRYDYPGGHYTAQCRRRSLWTAGALGLCGVHMAGRLEMGD